jgi:MFS transporter, FHS family, L-fucose permease
MQVLAARKDRGKEKEICSGDSVFPSGQMLLFVLVTVLFFLWGMSNNLTDILVQQFKKSFELSQLGAQLV